MENRNCQNCKQDFTIEPEDFEFYKKIDVPPPTFCSGCRKQRRLAFRNTHALYRRKDSATGKDIISIYSADKKLNVIDQKDWWADGWDAMDFGAPYDFLKPFFEQWKELRDRTPMQSLSNSRAVNSDYCNVAEESYDSYLVSASWGIERVMFSDAVTTLKDTLDVHIMHRSEFCYEDVNCSDSYKLFYSQDSYSSTDSYFLYDCKGCTNCFMSSSLRNKSYVWYNEQLSKDEYQEKIKTVDFGSYRVIEQKRQEFFEMKQKAIHRFAHLTNCVNVTGNHIEQGKNAYQCFDASGGIEDSRDVFWSAKGTKQAHSCGPGVGMVERAYECFDTGAGGGGYSFCSVVYYGTNIAYSFNCYNCKDVFGCIGLRNKQYCILNKQYTKEEYEALLPKIKKHMNDMPYVDRRDRVYMYGEFFPIELSPFCYNETVAQDYFPLQKEEVLARGYLWKDPEEKNHTPTIKSSDIPDDIIDVTESILNEVIECEHRGECGERCATVFKIVPRELEFYKRHTIPLPRLCYGCRHYRRLHARNPMHLWSRTCMCEMKTHTHHGKCTVSFQTSYAPNRPEIVYCEKCYQAEVI